MNVQIRPQPSPLPTGEGIRLLAPFSLGRRVGNEGNHTVIQQPPILIRADFASCSGVSNGSIAKPALSGIWFPRNPLRPSPNNHPPPMGGVISCSKIALVGGRRSWQRGNQRIGRLSGFLTELLRLLFPKLSGRIVKILLLLRSKFV